MRLQKILPMALAAGALAACGGEQAGRAPAQPQTVTVGVAPKSVEVQTGGTVRFGATVTGTADTVVLWEIVEAGGGSVDASGLYTAPGATGVFHVRATSRAAPEVRDEATVTVVANPVVAVTISPRTASVVAGGTVAFAATVVNAANGAVDWAVAPAGCGAITAAGVYTAPAGAAVCTVVATSQADPTKSDAATVTVTAPVPVVVTVAPSPGAVDACRTLTFAATVTGTTDTRVTWSVQEGAAGGAITAAGVYTAPSTAGTYHVVATSRADPARSAVVPVTVSDRILGVAVSPQTLQVPVGGTAQFTATVTTTCGAVSTTQTVTSTGAILAD